MLDYTPDRNANVCLNTGWYPELVFLTVVFLNSTDIAVVILNSTVKRYLFYTLQPCENPTIDSVYSIFLEECII